MPEITAATPLSVCPECGTALPPNLLSCPSCARLVHAEELRDLAEQATAEAGPTEALQIWRRALALLPEGSRQHHLVVAKIDALVQATESSSRVRAPQRGAVREKSSGWKKWAAGLGVGVLFVAKFKFLFVFLLTKAKLLVLGLSKASTLFSMLLSFGLYWSIWGWKFAGGLVLSIYVHEMGHVAMLRRLGVRASAPMFIPGFGAVVRLREHLPTAREEARVGLAGPIWGLGAVVAAWLLSVAFESPMCAAIARVGAWINLFNLAPVWQLDGSRAWRAFTRTQRQVATAAAVAALFFASEQGRLALLFVSVFSVIRLFEKETAPEPDSRALTEYLVLIVALSGFAALPVKLAN